MHFDRRSAAVLLLLRRHRRKRKRIWVHPINAKRNEFGEYHRLVSELMLDSQRFQRYFRMYANQMECLLNLVGPHITKQNTNYRKPIEPKQRLAITLRFLATGHSYASLAYSYRVGIETVSNIIEETCLAIVTSLVNIFMPKLTEQDWIQIANRFGERWNFPNCIGAIDGKHIVIRSPSNAGTLFFNYKGTFSIVLLALVDGDYRFRMIQCGDFGRTSDAGCYSNSRIGKGMEDKSMHVPGDVFLPDAHELGKLPYVIVGDAAFPLKTYLMRPYPGHNLSEDKRIFNYRLSRARRIVENAFGILTARWRIFHTKIHMDPRKVDTVIEATCLLHNYLQQPSENNEVWLQEKSGDKGNTNIASVSQFGGNRASREAFLVRDRFAKYFTSAQGAVAWQNNKINATN